MDMEVFFAGNKKVYANYKGFTVETDQPTKSGGDGSAPAPFDLFLVSLGTCAGLFVLEFMQYRKMPTEGTRLLLHTERDAQTHQITKMEIKVELPAGFPEKYRDAVMRSVQQCTVKRYIDNPPVFSVNVSIGGVRPPAP